MIEHDDIWRGIDKLAEEFGYSASGLAKASGLHATSFNPSKRHTSNGQPRWPSTETIARILDTTGSDMSHFADLIKK